MNDHRYYAIPDPDQPEVMTYWKGAGDLLLPWPAKARYGPQTPSTRLGGRGASRAVAQEMAARNTWMAKIRAEVAQHGDEASARFAALARRCQMCGQRLTDPLSRAVGLGPDCRAGMAADVIERFKAEVSRRKPEETR